MITHLMPSPYQTNCFDYNTIGCKSRSDCIDKCNIQSSLKQCNCLPSKTNVDRHNNKDHYYNITCSFNYTICEQKYKSPDCINEYYSSRTIFDFKIDEGLKVQKYNLLDPKIDHKNISLVTIVYTRVVKRSKKKFKLPLPLQFPKKPPNSLKI